MGDIVIRLPQVEGYGGWRREQGMREGGKAQAIAEFVECFPGVKSICPAWITC